MDGITSRHGSPNMKKTFDKLATFLRTCSPNEVVLERKTAHAIENMLDKGIGLMSVGNTAENEDEDGEGNIEPEDLNVEGPI